MYVVATNSPSELPGRRLFARWAKWRSVRVAPRHAPGISKAGKVSRRKILDEMQCPDRHEFSTEQSPCTGGILLFVARVYDSFDMRI